MSNGITITINDEPFHFDVTDEIHERLINEMQKDSKVGPMRNFLVRSVAAECKEALRPFLQNPRHIVDIAGKVYEKVAPGIELKLGE